jgi:hypothetical protein
LGISHHVALVPGGNREIGQKWGNFPPVDHPGRIQFAFRLALRIALMTERKRLTLSVVTGKFKPVFALAGRVGTTGENYLGFWHWGLLFVGSMYGGPVGAVMGPVAYATTVRTIGFKRATVPAMIGTIIGGVAGSLIVPLLGLLTGVMGFFVSLLIARLRYFHPNKEGVVQ